MAASENVRKAVATAADSLSSRCASRPFDDKLGAKDWQRVRMEWMAEAESAGPDFLAALRYAGNISPAADYGDDLVLLDSDAGAPGPMLKHVRQGALLSWLRKSLPTDSESYRLVQKCAHAGGRIGVEGRADGDKQALMILDERWRSPVSEEDAGSDADKLFGMRWPATVGESEFNEFFNSIVSGASKVGLNPIDDSAASIQLRSLWWNRFSAPPAKSAYSELADRARVVTQQQKRTVAHRDAFHAAMIEEIKKSGGATSTRGGGRMRTTSATTRAMACARPRWPAA